MTKKKPRYESRVFDGRIIHSASTLPRTKMLLRGHGAVPRRLTSQAFRPLR
jgi:hypothetical protein